MLWSQCTLHNIGMDFVLALLASVRVSSEIYRDTYIYNTVLVLYRWFALFNPSICNSEECTTGVSWNNTIWKHQPSCRLPSVFFSFSSVIFRFSQHHYEPALLANIHSRPHSCLNIQFSRTLLHHSKKMKRGHLSEQSSNQPPSTASAWNLVHFDICNKV